MSELNPLNGGKKSKILEERRLREEREQQRIRKQERERRNKKRKRYVGFGRYCRGTS